MSNPPPAPPSPRPRFTTPGRVLVILSLAAIAGAMYWVLTTEAIAGMMKLLAACGVLLAGVLIVSAVGFFFDGRHKK